MENNTKKIVVLDRLNSPRIEQAIFILRDAKTVSETDAVSEAQRIVNTYLESLSGEEGTKKKRFNTKIFFAMLAYTLITMILTAIMISKIGV